MFAIKQRTLGLDIGCSSVKWILYNSGKKCTIYNHGILKLPSGWVEDGRIVNPLGLASRLNSVLEGQHGKISGASVTLCCTEMIIRTVYLPRLGPGEMENAVRYEMEYLFPKGIKEYIFDFRVLGEEMREGILQTRVLICGLPLVIAEEYLELLNILNLRPRTFDFHGNSAARVLGVLKEENIGKGQMIIDIGAHITAITFVEKGVPVFARLLKKGGVQITRSIAEAFGIAPGDGEKLKKEFGSVFLKGQRPKDDKESKIEECIMPFVQGLLDEINSSVQYYNSRSGHDVGFVLLAGGSSYLKGLRSYITSKTGLREISRSSILSYLNNSGFSAEQLERFINVLGLALRPYKSGRGDINLLPAVHRDARKTKRAGWIRLLAVTMAAAIAVGTIFFPLYYRENLRMKNKELWHEIENRGKVIELRYREEHLARQLVEREGIISRLSLPHTKWSSFLIETVERAPSDIRIEVVSYSGKGIVIIKGLAVDYSTVAGFVDILQGLDRIDIVQPVSLRLTEDGALDFELKCGL